MCFTSLADILFALINWSGKLKRLSAKIGNMNHSQGKLNSAVTIAAWATRL